MFVATILPPDVLRFAGSCGEPIPASAAKPRVRDCARTWFLSLILAELRCQPAKVALTDRISPLVQLASVASTSRSSLDRFAAVSPESGTAFEE